MPTKPFNYQKEGVRAIEGFDGRALLADDMGLGKTLQVLWWMRRNKPSPVVIVCPASLKWNWQNEANKHMNLNTHVIEGRCRGKRNPLRHCRTIIINYDILESWLDHLIEIEPEAIVLDETHYVKNPRAARSKACRELCRNAPQVIAVSGTPLTNKPAELWHTLKLVRPDMFPKFVPFARRYCRYRLTRWGWQYSGAQRLDELHEKLRDQVMIRRRKADVLKDLPPKTLTVTPVQITKPREYQQALQSFKTWLRQNHNKNIKSQRAERLVKHGYLLRLAAELKLPTVFNWIDSFLNESDEKLIVFGVHHNILKPLHARYHQSVIINSTVTGRKRQLAVDRFQNNRKTRILFGNIQAAGVGLNMTAASNVVFVELPWTPAEVNQAIDRAHRIGQKAHVQATFLVAKGTVEEKLCNLLQSKQVILSATLDGHKGATDLDILRQLEREIINER